MATNLKVIFSLTVMLCLSMYPLELEAWNMGDCPNLSVQQDFDVARYAGKWFGQATYNLFEKHVTCMYVTYTKSQSGFFETNSVREANGSWVHKDAVVTLDDPSRKEGKLTIRSAIDHTDKTKQYILTQYWILETDYKTFSVVYSCENRYFYTHVFSVMFLSRTQNVYETEKGKEYIRNTNRVLHQHNISPSVMVQMMQSDCFSNQNTTHETGTETNNQTTVSKPTHTETGTEKNKQETVSKPTHVETGNQTTTKQSAHT